MSRKDEGYYSAAPFVHSVEQSKHERKCLPFISILIIIKLQCSEYTLLTHPTNLLLASAWNQSLIENQHNSPLYSLSIHLDCVMRQGTSDSNEKKIFITFLLEKENLFNSGKNRKFSSPVLLNKSIDESMLACLLCFTFPLS